MLVAKQHFCIRGPPLAVGDVRNLNEYNSPNERCMLQCVCFANRKVDPVFLQLGMAAFLVLSEFILAKLTRLDMSRYLKRNLF